MPNWVSTDIECFGGYYNEMKEAVASEERVIDFNKVIPMPESLNVESGSQGDLYMAWLLSDKGTKLISMDESERYYGRHRHIEFYRSLITLGGRANLALLNERIQNVLKNGDVGLLEHQKGIELGQTYIDNVEKYGFRTWYDWSIENWGTKWNCCEPWVEDNVFRFETAWSYPEPVIRKLMKEYKISSTICVVDEGLCFWGKQMYIDGNLESDQWGKTEDLFSILRTVWGYDETAQMVETSRHKRRKGIVHKQTWSSDENAWWVTRNKDEVLEK